MFKFFRRIRYDLIGKNDTGKYLKYAIGEIILVVIGILIALQINNLNEERKSESTRQDYYQQLLEDLIKDKEFADITIQNFMKEQIEYDHYLNTFSTQKLTPLQVYQNLTELNLFSTEIEFNSSITETLLSSGDINIIPSAIRNKLSDLRKKQNVARESADKNDEGKKSLVRNVSLLIGSFSLSQRIDDQPNLKKFLHLDENLKEIILAMEAVQVWKSNSQKGSIRRLEEIKIDIEILIKLIKQELK